MSRDNNKPAVRFQGFSDAWEQRKLGEVVSEYADPVPTPHEGYERLGIRSHGKGTFHNYVKAGRELETAKMHRVAKNKLIVNITFAWEHAVAVTDENDAGKLVSHRFPQFSLSETIDPGFLHYLVLDDAFRHHLWLASPGGAGRNRVLKIPEMLEYKIQIPSVQEQKQIATTLNKLDNLITLHQRKYDKLVTVKKSMLEKMFPREGSDVPEIRFEGFPDAWEQRKLGDCFEFLQNNTLSRAELSTEAGAALNVHYGDVLIKFGEYLDVSSEQMAYIPDQSIVGKYKASLLDDGDIIMADTAEDETVGKCCEIAGLQGKSAISGLHTIPLRPVEKFSPGFLGYYMNSGAYHDQLLPLMQGIKVTSVSKNAIRNTDISYPADSAEQAAIGQYFIRLDNLITLHQRKLDKLKNIKKSMLEKMFV